MPKSNNKKICIVVSSLGKGGAERSSAILSQILYDVGYDIHIVCVINKIEYPYKGKLLNLGALKTENDTSFDRLKRLRILKIYLKTHQFNYVIDNRSRRGFFQEFIISKLIFNPKKTIYCIRSYNTDLYINPNPFLGRLLYNNAFKVVAVSNAIAKKVKAKYNFKNVTKIYNAVNFEESDKATRALGKSILFFGRIDDDVKNISLLLEGYSKSKLPVNDIKLKILGDGKDLEKLKKKTYALNIDSKVQFLPHNPNPSTVVKEALFTVLTSRYEGFPRSIIESLALGVPVISVDCKSGPNEIIAHNTNGLLIENHNPEALAQAMNRLFEDKALYLHCRENAKNSVVKFSEENIASHWQTLLS